MRVKRSNARRGVLLIVILGLLAMFALIAVAFVVLTGRALQGAKQGQRFDEYPKWPRRDLNRAFMQVVRGPNNTLSAMKAHCLLEDIYGYDPAGYTVANPGTLAGYTPVLGGQLFEFNLTNSYRHVGCVLTMLDGAAAGQSTLIVGIDPTNDLPQALSFQQGVPADGDKFVINGAPFSGAGFGYNAGTGSLNATSGTGEPLALLPGALPQYPPGRANEDYDAVDFQNMLLAALIYTPGGDTGLGPFGAAGPTVRVIPSLHRPALIDYHGGANIQNCLRPLKQDSSGTLIHPNFTGSNPNFNPSWDGITPGQGQWDVDNDGDGVPDSIWVDLAMPVRSTADGRLYKPLFAILCVDLDGRLNLNAHGMSDQALGSSYTIVTKPSGVKIPCYTAAVSEAPVAGAGQLRFADGATGVNQVFLPRGQGYGPAEINLLPLFDDPFNPGTFPFMPEYRKLLVGSGVVGGRYGEVGSAKPGFSGVDDALSFNRHFGYPDNYTNVALPTAYGTPPDLWGIMAVGVDLQGQPIFASLGGQWSPALADDPYEINLSPATTRGGLSASAGTPPADNPFSVTELERLLRPFDRDSAALPARLRNLTFPGGQSASALHWRRYSITTESWNVPAPSPAIPKALRTRLGRWPRHVTDLLAAQAVPRADWPFLVAPELLHGLKMNVNRPFGNRFDDDGNLVVDEPAEAAAGEQVSLYTSPVATTAFNVDHANDGPGGGPADEMARQIYARNLFVLMMLLRDSGYQFDSPTEGWSADEKREMTIRRIAQWAVNCVDFRDSDSIMTPFEYDEDPLDGWDVDGIIGSTDDTQPHRGLVWGCERPELLLTEATAFHDRRVADTAHDNGDLPDKGWKRTDDHDTNQIPDDNDLDQIQIPQGSAFFGLYCTRNHANSAAPGDLYLHIGGEWVLDLGRMAPAGTTGDPKLQLQYPVWRMVVTKSAIKDPAKNNIIQRLADCPDSASLETQQFVGQVPSSCQFSLLRGCTDAEVEIERIVWFANQQPNGHYDEDRVFYNRRAAAGLPAGRYAVVGPRAVTAIGSKKGSANLGDPSLQQILLDPTPAAANPFTTTDSTGGPNYRNTSNEIKKPIGIIVAADPPTTWTDTGNTAPEGIGINISEPLPSSTSYYPEPTHQNPNSNIWDAYGDLTQVDPAALFRDEPLDSQPGTPLEQDGLTATGTTVNYKAVFLQRLADPTRPFDPTANPYRTVDWMPIDLTVFNGADTIPPTTEWPPPWAPAGFNEEWDPDDPSTNTKTVKFKTRQRGKNGANDFNIWAQLSDDPTDSNKAGASNHFDYELQHTLGYINQPYWDTSGGPQWLTTGGGVPAEYRGDPTTPFPWLTWNNRPYISELEMLLVPSSYPGRLLMEFDLAAGTPDPFTDYTQPFPHLLNFFTSEASAAGGTSPQFHRVLEYLHVPSPFVGTRVPANAATCTAVGHWFHPPQNWISLYREPGRVNLNTIFSPDVFQGVMNYFPGMSDPVFWKKFVESRRGYPNPANPTVPNILLPDNRYPTRFAAPFRSFAGGEMVPPLTSGVSLKPNREVGATLLRRDPAHADRPLFQFDSVLKTETALTAQQFGPFNNPDRNAFFRYQGIQRLGNLVTTRSNVYAIWITVGYFEVEANPGGVDPAHPDGYRLGAELGSDTGDIERHRGFYIFDRSIPVGFDRGKDLNVENAVLLRRYIE